MFSTLYARVLSWSRHPHAPWYLGGLSFAESSFFPIPPDVMLAPMALAQPQRAWRFALITTLASVVGGMFGYLLGAFFFDTISPLLHDWGYWERFLTVKAWFAEYGIWIIFIAGFSPIPYKVFTISAGVVAMSFFPFIMASAISRGARFFLVAGLMYWGGEKMEQGLRRYVDVIGWGVVALVLVLYFIMKGT